MTMILHEKCDPKLAQDKKLPYTAYLVQYEVDGKVHHDIAVAGAAVELFDTYYDKYKKDFKWVGHKINTKPCLLFFEYI